MDRIRELDGLRGVAAVTILAYHLRPAGAIPMGWAAVDVFFVLSGYLITAIILRHMDSAGFLRAFYFRRGLRIWPPYLVALAALIVVDYSLGDRIPLRYLPSFLTFTQGLSWLAGPDTPHPAWFSHTWTLAIEEQFYLIWPALMMILGRRSIVPLAILIAAVSEACRASGVPPFLLASRCDGFAAGSVVAALLSARVRSPGAEARLRRALALVASALIAALAYQKLAPRLGLGSAPVTHLLLLNPLFACLIGLVVLDAGSGRVSLLRSRPLVHLGTLSYGLYLYHSLAYYLVFVPGDRLGFGPSLGRDALALALAWLIAAASWRYLERPALAWKELVPYERRPRPTDPRSVKGRSTFGDLPDRAQDQEGGFATRSPGAIRPI